MRRIAAGIVLHDTRVLVDPLRTQSRGADGCADCDHGLIGSGISALIRPTGSG